MDRALTAFLGGSRRRSRGGWTLRVLTARELLQARAEAAELTEKPEEEGLCLNACVTARAVSRRGRQVFRSGREALDRLTAEQIGAAAEAYFSLCRREDPSCCREGWQALKQGLRQAGYERLKWKILKSFGVLPSEARAREMTDGDFLYCALQTILDAEEEAEKLCPACRQRQQEKRCPVCGAGMGEENPNFDEKRFEELKHHGVSGGTAAGA